LEQPSNVTKVWASSSKSSDLTKPGPTGSTGQFRSARRASSVPTGVRRRKSAGRRFADNGPLRLPRGTIQLRLYCNYQPTYFTYRRYRRHKMAGGGPANGAVPDTKPCRYRPKTFRGQNWSASARFTAAMSRKAGSKGPSEPDMSAPYPRYQTVDPDSPSSCLFESFRMNL
jgi:hypothetical protein